ncbi:MAG: hypothetical protein LBJ23_05090 [Tannerella sp.]|jgi:hypothetical protein|nr:hypothetical protein [Tannerella sp.]
MEAKQSKLEKLKGQNPFRVPEGYMEALTSQIMSRIPDNEPQKETKVISLGERLRPLLYLAAVFIGLIFLFKVFINPATPKDDALQNGSAQMQASDAETVADDEEFLEYMQQHYYSDLLAESLENID